MDLMLLRPRASNPLLAAFNPVPNRIQDPGRVENLPCRVELNLVVQGTLDLINNLFLVLVAALLDILVDLVYHLELLFLFLLVCRSVGLDDDWRMS